MGMRTPQCDTPASGAVDECMISLALVSAAMFLDSLAAKQAIEFQTQGEETPDWERTEEEDAERKALMPLESSQLFSLSRRLAYTNSHVRRENKESVREAGRLLGIVRALMEKSLSDGAEQINYREVWEENLKLLKRVEEACAKNEIQECSEAARQQATLSKEQPEPALQPELKYPLTFLAIVIGIILFFAILRILLP